MKLTAISDRALVRLVRDGRHKPPVLRELVDTGDEMAVLAGLEVRSSARLLAERERAPGVDRRELAFERRQPGSSKASGPAQCGSSSGADYPVTQQWSCLRRQVREIYRKLRVSAANLRPEGRLHDTIRRVNRHSGISRVPIEHDQYRSI